MNPPSHGYSIQQPGLAHSSAKAGGAQASQDAVMLINTRTAGTKIDLAMASLLSECPILA